MSKGIDAMLTHKSGDRLRENNLPNLGKFPLSPSKEFENREKSPIAPHSLPDSQFLLFSGSCEEGPASTPKNYPVVCVCCAVR